MTHVTLLRCRYGAYLAKEQITNPVVSYTYMLKLVESWLKHHSMASSNVSTSHGGRWLTVTGVPVSKADDFLGVSYQLYQHARTNEDILCMIGYVLPAARSRRRCISARRARCGQGHVYTVAGQQRHWSDDDLKEFMRRYCSDAEDPTSIVIDINDGGYDLDKPGNEANLNIQYTQGTAWPTPYTVSSSYGGGEQTFPPDYVTKLGARGVSILFPSGVGGADCKKNGDSGVVQFQPNFPATRLIPVAQHSATDFADPWVASVGGTMKRDPEIATPLSSGGSSNSFERQTDVVTGFFRRFGDQYAGRPLQTIVKGTASSTSRRTRAVRRHYVFPPISLRRPSSNTQLTADVQVVAGTISLLNDYQLSFHRPVLGFLNLWLYNTASQGLDNITSGSNPGCATDGFSAVPGRDVEIQRVYARRYVSAYLP
ncbi:subtilisin-like protein [Lactarius indigo]|nr:subtilisin-like protein [Lactarius indigo]